MTTMEPTSESEPTVAAAICGLPGYLATISLTGYPGSGKDTLARELIEREREAGWLRLAYADALKEYAVDIEYLLVDDFGDTFAFTSREEIERVKRDAFWGPAIRYALQTIGEQTRKLDPDIWVDQLHKKWLHNRAPCVITDVRYPNEVKGLLVAVVRPGHDKVNNHESEVNTEDLIARADIVLLNDGTPEDLYNKLRTALHARPTK